MKDRWQEYMDQCLRDISVASGLPLRYLLYPTHSLTVEQQQDVNRYADMIHHLYFAPPYFWLGADAEIELEFQFDANQSSF